MYTRTYGASSTGLHKFSPGMSGDTLLSTPHSVAFFRLILPLMQSFRDTGEWIHRTLAILDIRFDGRRILSSRKTPIRDQSQSDLLRHAAGHLRHSGDLRGHESDPHILRVHGTTNLHPLACTPAFLGHDRRCQHHVGFVSAGADARLWTCASAQECVQPLSDELHARAFTIQVISTVQ